MKIEDSGFLDGFAAGKPSFKPKRTPWDYTCPKYDDRCGPSINAGTKYGVGKAQPIGREGNPKARVVALPYGRVATMKVDES